MDTDTVFAELMSARSKFWLFGSHVGTLLHVDLGAPYLRLKSLAIRRPPFGDTNIDQERHPAWTVLKD